MTTPLVNQNFVTRVSLKIYQYLKKRVENPRWFVMLVTSRFKNVPLLKNFFLKPHSIKKNNKGNYSLFPEMNVDDVVKSLKQESFYLGLKLPKDILQEIQEFASSTNCYGDGEYSLGFCYSEKEKAEAKLGRTFKRGDYFNSNLLCTAIKKLTNDPNLLEIAAKYLGGSPVLTGTRLWWLFAVNEQDKHLLVDKMTFLSTDNTTKEGAYFFHYDLDDYYFLKMFFYIVDVDLDNGAHVCVRGSHNKKKLAHLLSLFRRRSDQDIIDFYGAENVLPICGKAGFGFAEDTFCFHKAMVPTHRDRLMLQIQFALTDYGNHNDLIEPSALKKIFKAV